MVLRYYRAEYIDKAGKVQASYSFQAKTNAIAVIEARNYKQKILGCDYCKFKTVITLTAKVSTDPEIKRPRGRLRKRGINKFNR
jgi:hypothetical protein